MSSEIAVTATNLGKCYHIYDRPRDRLKQTLFRGRRQFYREFWALRGVGLEVRKGDTLGIIGRNGSGKSTLLQMLAGTLTPTTGDVLVAGRVAALLELGAGFNPEFTGRENVFMNGAILGIGRAEMQRRFDDIAAFADIGAFIDQPIKTYSSGMLVRLAFSVSINIDPDILIIDEALAVGDAAFQFKCLDRLNELTTRGVTLLFVSHSMDMVRTFCKQVVYLQGGEIKASGPPEEITELYLFDVRADQSRHTKSALSWKRPLYTSGQSAFGTDDGRILRAEFDNGRGQYSLFTPDERITFEIDAEFKSTIRGAHLGVVVQDLRLAQLGGMSIPLEGVPVGDGTLRSRVQCSFPAKLAKGRYFITLRLEDRVSDELFFPIDKQAGLMSFEIARSRREFLGAVDLGFDVLQLPWSQVANAEP
jgi:lipopolysaccharide transport system ATP-binding protein